MISLAIRIADDEQQYLLGFCNDSYIVEDSKGLIRSFQQLLCFHKLIHSIL